MKRPSFQFYPADWRNNAKLRRCSEAARGAWIDVLCLMHDSDEYGVLRWPLSDISRATGVSLKLLKELVDREVLKGGDKGCEAFIHTPYHARKPGEPVVLLNKTDGCCWYSSRFLKDEWKRSVSGGDTRFKTPSDAPSRGKVKGKVNDNPSPSDAPSRAVGAGASSSSSSINPTSQPVSARDPEKFAMRIGWEPSAHVADLAKQSGAPLLDCDLPELVAHWLTEPSTKRTQAEWDKALLQSAKHRKLREASPAPPRGKAARTPENFAEKNYGTEIRPL